MGAERGAPNGRPAERGVRVGLGGLIHVVMEQRPLFGLLGRIFGEVEAMSGGGRLSLGAEDEILAACGGLPLAVSDLRAPVDPVVGVTDACETGGGACESQGLSGLAGLGERLSEERTVPVFLVTLGDESSAVMSGLDVLGLEPQAWVSLGASAASGRCARNCWPA